MGGRGQMEGTMEYLCRIALCEGALMDRVRDTATIEARSGEQPLRIQYADASRDHIIPQHHTSLEDA